MAANDDVLIVGKLDSKELEKSIDALVWYVNESSKDMAENFDSAMDKMKLAMKDFAITQKVSVDLIKEAWKDMSASFDAMVAAQSGATGGGKGSGKDAFDDGTVGQLKELINLEEQRRDKMYLGTEELRKQNELLDEQRAQLRSETTSDPKKLVQQYSSEIKRANLMMDKSLPDAERKLREMLRIKNELRATPVLDADAMAALDKKILVLIGRIRDMRQNARGNTLKDVLGMDESSVDAVARKMRALKSIKVGNASEIHQLGSEYQRLSRLQAELLGKGIQLTHSNNYLAQSFGYIRNRIVYALTLGAVTNFTKQVYEIRGQYELLERSLGILINDMRKGTEMFNELNAMALKSPFTLMELATGAKQLLAYNFAEEEVVDTTRRLADISAALGVPMERLVYNLGQIKAQTALTARDARDFANAGLAIVPMLAQMYTEQKRFGDEIVTTAQVFDMMSKKMVSYNDVMKVINKVTDEGGKFFDFQAKQADTLRVKMANLTLAWNNMLNEVGQDNQGVLELPLRGLKTLFENWRALVKVVKEVILVFGAYKAAAMLVSLWNSRLAVQGAVMAFFELAKSVKSAKDAMILFNTVCKANPIGLIASAIAAAVGYFYLFNDAMDDAGGYTEKFGKAGAKVVTETEALFDTLKGMSRESSNYKKVMGELNSILEEYGIETVKETDGMDVLNEKRRVAIALIKEETLERKHLNDVQQGRDEYASTVEEARKKMRSQLKEAVTGMYGFVSANDELRQNASAIANIISDVVEQNISLIAGKTGEEYEKGVNKIYDTIQQRMRDIGISESTISKQWLDDTLFLKNDIVADFIGKIREAKEEQDRYIESIDKAYESEKKAAESGASFNDRVEQTQTQLMKAANDTENFYKKVDQLVKDYSGLNIIDFLVKVKTEVPAWMSQKGLTELTQLSARFAALATQAKKAGKDSLDFGNGNVMTVEQLFQRAAQYAQAAQNKAADIESRKSTTITREASEALKEYKSALNAVAVAKNRVKQGTADNSLVTEKETEAQAKYNKALKAGVSLEELKKAKEGKNKGSKKDPLGDALTKEIQLITEMQKLYKDYQKAGVDADKARIASSNEYKKSLIAQNNVLKSFGIKGLDSSELVKMDARQLRDYYKNLREIASVKGNTKGIEALEKAISNLNVEITKVDYKKITDGLNNELGKLKDEYELAVELDANPELGSMFADWMGIDMSDLPRTASEYAERASKILNNKLKDLGAKTDLPNLLSITDDDMRAFEENKVFTDKQLELVKKAVEAARGFQRKETEDRIKDWDKLLEKYAEYETKVNKIHNDAVKEHVSFAQQFGSDGDKSLALNLQTQILAATDPQERQRLIQQLQELVLRIAGDDKTKINLVTAINNSEQQGVAKANFEEYQKSPEWIAATGDLAGMTTKAIGYLISSLEKYKKSAKNLDPKQIKQINSALKNLHRQQRQGNPFLQIADAIDRAKERSKEFEPEMKKVEEEIAALEEEIGDNDATEEQAKQLKTLKDRWVELASMGKVSATEYVNAINSSIAAASQAIGMFTDMADALGGKHMTEATKTIKDVVSVLDKAGQGAALGAQIGGGWGALIGGVAGGLTGLISTFADQWSGNASITEKVEDSVRAVKRLELAYVDLQQAVDKAYGTATIGAKQATLANKELQLAEIQRQIELEKSRSSKNRDEDKIIELQKQYKELFYEIQNGYTEIVDDLMGTDVASFAENLVSSMIDAFKQGEDYMKVFSDKFDEMIDNMIMKSIVSRVVSQYLDQIWDNIDSRINDRSKKEREDYAKAQERLSSISGMYDAEIAREIAQERSGNNIFRFFAELNNVTNKDIEEYKKAVLAEESAAKARLDAATEFTGSDVDYIMGQVAEVMPELGQKLKEILGEYYKFGESSETQLSALQQGIAGVSEETASAVEAYLNGMSQQAYLRNDLLTQIRDAVVSFDLDVQVATTSQMLLQLQQSYQVQLAIQNILNGWSNPSGMAVRVEMV